MKTFTLLLLAISLGIWLAPLSPALYESRPVAVNTEAVTPTPTPPPTKAEIVYEIAKAFEPEGVDVINQALQVAKNESGWKHNAMGWNCHYYDENGKRYSAACKKEDRVNAWSVDCGIMQINTAGKVCPEELFDIKVNLTRALAKYEHNRWNQWVAAKRLGYAL